MWQQTAHTYVTFEYKMKLIYHGTKLFDNNQFMKMRNIQRKISTIALYLHIYNRTLFEYGIPGWSSFFMWTLPFWLFLFQLHQFKCFRNYFNNDISVICSKQLKPLEVRTLNINSNKKCNQYMKVGPHLYFMEHKPKSFHRKKYIHTKEKNKVT